MKIKLSVIMPVYNEENTVAKCINMVRRVAINKEIIVIDDCSTDSTRNVLNMLQSQNSNIRVFYHDKNKGKGATIGTGIRYAIGDYIIIQDADLEYDPGNYSKLIEEAEINSAKVVYGSRFKNKKGIKITLHFLANKFLTFLTNILYKSNLTDMETCHKLIERNLMLKLGIKARGFEFEPEITAKILKSGCKIHEVPVQYIGRKASEGKKVTWRDGIQAIYCLVKYKVSN